MDTLIKSMTELLTQPASLFTLLAVLIFILGYLQMRRIHFTTGMLINVALMLALTIVLHQLRLFHMPQGGSITLGAMVPLLFLTYRYGAGIGCLAGFLYGMINLMQDAFIVHPLQVLFDYPLPYMALAIAAAVPGRLYAGAALAFSARFLCHYISGVVFFGSYAPPDMSPYLYSLVFNATYLVPEAVICLVILRILPVPRLLAAMDQRTPLYGAKLTQ
ncbi:energy-coupled thiamine transporter ThiT [Selenomonas sp. oral taxon 892]|uniref:energy-coupled thiamine transporter ThiT n=1 Tax=Selenomonas sp. oral taxon 892 TaxID=1321785 RepID=UPI0003AD37C7|nr:energy-coupled thiamine transporter ThiT [Selenomonas sp. oral taxon 892]ERJ92694.1 putative proton-coupled thiamine transporter YuaJ [Selenomonas sp. oral taxon 892 str. F0426]